MSIRGKLRRPVSGMLSICVMLSMSIPLQTSEAFASKNYTSAALDEYALTEEATAVQSETAVTSEEDVQSGEGMTEPEAAENSEAVSATAETYIEQTQALTESFSEAFLETTVSEQAQTELSTGYTEVETELPQTGFETAEQGSEAIEPSYSEIETQSGAELYSQDETASMTEEDSFNEELSSETASEGASDSDAAEEETAEDEAFEEVSDEELSEEASEEETSESEEESLGEASLVGEYKISSNGYVISDTALYAIADVSSGAVDTVSAGQEVYVMDYYEFSDESGMVHIMYDVNEYCYEGYVDAMAVEINYDISLLAANDADSFPDSYKPYINALKAAHPNWTFVAVNTGDTFDYAVSMQMNETAKAVVSTAYGAEWRSLLSRDYNSNTKTWIEHEPGWVGASETAIRWTMDPRNFLNANDIFMFESLKYEDGQTESAVQAILKGTFMEGNVPGESYTYAWLFCWIGKRYDINPISLASRCKQEQGSSGGSALISGNYPGYVGLYNYFNILAYGSTRAEIISRGLQEARTGTAYMEMPAGSSGAIAATGSSGSTYYYSKGSWNTPAKAIVGGALKFANNYVVKGQNTLYAQKYDYVGRVWGKYAHQYMTNINAPYAEGLMVQRAYSNVGIINEAITFYIPVYSNMPSASPKPGTAVSANNYLKALTVNGKSAALNNNNTSYTIDVGSATYAEVKATAADSSAVVNFTNPGTLKSESTTVTITVTAQNGNKRNYSLVIRTKLPEPTTTAPATTTAPDATNPNNATYPTVYKGVDYSSVFNAIYYLNKYADLKKAFGTNYTAALEHFVVNGIAEGRQACEDFNVEIYKSNYSDLRTAFGSANSKYVEHYINYGKKEGRNGKSAIKGGNTNTTYKTVYNGTDYAKVYNAVYYLDKYSDLKKAFGTNYDAALAHFVTNGIREGRQASADFSIAIYKSNYADLRSAFGADNAKYVNHYLTLGLNEGRVGNRLISGSGNNNGSSNSSYPTVYNGYDYALVFDPKYYLDKYADLKRAFGTDYNAALKHFVTNGIKEGRQAIASFSVTEYKARYEDLRKAFGSDNMLYVKHYITNGKKENRKGN